MNAQNRRRCSCRATKGPPGDLSLPRKTRSERRRPAIATLFPNRVATTNRVHLFCYDESDGRSLWRDWYNSASDEVKEKYDTKWEFLEVNEASEWGKVDTKTFNDFVEIRLPGKVAWRVMGFFGPGRHEFTVVLVCFHKGAQYTPKKCLKTVKSRISEVRQNLNRRKLCARPK
jgi:hypothetical protein